MILADASVWIDYLGGRPSAEVERLDALIGEDRFAVGDLTLTEVLQGISNEQRFERILFRLSALPVIVVGGGAMAVKAANNYRFLRERGFTIRKTIDTLIATRCIEDGQALLFSDRDFDPFVTHLGLVSAMDD